MTITIAASGRSCRRFRDAVRLAVAALIFSLPCGLGRGEEDSTKTLGPPGRLGLTIDDSLVPGRLVVVEVEPSGPAAKAGVRVQDMVLAIDGEPTLNAESFAAAIATIDPGDDVRFAIGRGGVVEEVTLIADDAASPRRSAFGQPPSPFPSAAGHSSAGPVATAAAPQPVDAAPSAVSMPAFSEPRPSPDRWQGSPGSVAPGSVTPGNVASGRTPPAENGRGKTALGVRTVPVDPVVQARYSLPEPTGALVVGLVEDLPASRAGLPTGSVIVAFDRQPVRSPTDLTKLVSEGPTDRPVKLEYILPGGEPRAADVSLVSVTAETAAVTMNSSTLSPTPVNRGAAAPAIQPGSAADSDREALRLEILQIRKAIDSLVRRLDDLESRGSIGTR